MPQAQVTSGTMEDYLQPGPNMKYTARKLTCHHLVRCSSWPMRTIEFAPSFEFKDMHTLELLGGNLPS